MNLSEPVRGDFPINTRGEPFVSCVVPCRNEAENLRVLVPLLVSTLSQLAARWEIVLVDDGSTDATAGLLPVWTLQPGVRAIELSRNFGKEAALSAGLAAAAGSVVVMMDADLQHPAKMIADMLARWKDGADVVYAVRVNRDDESRVKQWGAHLFYRFLNSGSGVRVPEGAGDFRLMDRAVVDALLSLPERNRFMKGLYAWVGFRAVALPYVPDSRNEGSSHYGLLQLCKLSLDGLTSFTTWPLRLVSACGIALALVGFCYGAYLCLCYFLYGHTVSGWTTIVVSMMFFFGMQMLSLGIVGEYIGRIFEEVKGRPLYVVRREWGQGAGPRR